MRDALNFDRAEETEAARAIIRTLNEEQRAAFEKIDLSVAAAGTTEGTEVTGGCEGRLFFLTGCGGSGKTHVAKV